MPLLALPIALLLAGPVYGGDCSGTAPHDLCEAGRPALTASSLTLSGKRSDGTGATGKVEAVALPQGPLGDLRLGVRRRGAAVDGIDTRGVQDALDQARARQPGRRDSRLRRPDRVAPRARRRARGARPSRRGHGAHAPPHPGWVPSHAVDDIAALDAVKEVDLGPAGFDFTYGFGRADAFQALTFVSSGPHVQLALSLNRHSVAPGDLLEVGLFESNVGTATAQDFYFGALVPARPVEHPRMSGRRCAAVLRGQLRPDRRGLLHHRLPAELRAALRQPGDPRVLAADRRRQLRCHVAGGCPGRDVHVRDLDHAAGRLRRRHRRPDRHHRPGPRRPPGRALTRPARGLIGHLPARVS